VKVWKYTLPDVERCELAEHGSSIGPAQHEMAVSRSSINKMKAAMAVLFPHS
jgi:hypothetical protein